MYRRILVPIDGSATSNRALDEALAWVRSYPDPAAAQVTVLHVLDDALDQQELADRGNAVLAQAAAQAAAVGVTVATLMNPVVEGSIAAAVLAQAAAGQADLIVMGTHSRKGLGRVVLGSVAEEVIRDSPVPVLLPGHRR